MLPSAVLVMQLVLSAQAPSTEDRLYALGARSVKRDASVPGHPIAEVSFARARSMNDEALAAIAADIKDVVILDLSTTAVSDRGLASLERLPKLTVVDLSFTRITDAGLEAIGKWKALRNVSVLGTEVTDLGIENLLRATKLDTLNVAHTKVTVRGLRAIAKHATIRELSISSKEFKDEDLKWLANMALRSLHLRSCIALTKDSLVHVRKIKSLAALELSYTLCSDEWIPQLAMMTGLTELKIRATLVSERGEKRLQELLPHTKVHRDKSPLD